MGGVLGDNHQEVMYNSIRPVVQASPYLAGGATRLSPYLQHSSYSEVSGYSADTDTLGVALTGRTVTVKPVTTADFAEWRRLRERNTERLADMGLDTSNDPNDEEGFDEYLDRREFGRLVGTAHMFGVFVGGELVGEIGLGAVTNGLATGVVTAWIDEAHWGHEIVEEAFALLCRHAFDDLELNRVEALVLHDNTAVVRALEKVGLRQEGIASEAAPVRGEWRDHDRYALTARQWRENQTLQDLLRT